MLLLTIKLSGAGPGAKRVTGPKTGASFRSDTGPLTSGLGFYDIIQYFYYNTAAQCKVGGGTVLEQQNISGQERLFSQHEQNTEVQFMKNLKKMQNDGSDSRGAGS